MCHDESEKKIHLMKLFLIGLKTNEIESLIKFIEMCASSLTIAFTDSDSLDGISLAIQFDGRINVTATLPISLAQHFID